ncbi:hypothetical protein BC835DRAFT_1308813 [Cytidiella melzeri]|nr:hypothetical protein BC835DRAFT_1308813 [Cytidiella melzeri]
MSTKLPTFCAPHASACVYELAANSQEHESMSLKLSAPQPIKISGVSLAASIHIVNPSSINHATWRETHSVTTAVGYSLHTTGLTRTIDDAGDLPTKGFQHPMGSRDTDQILPAAMVMSGGPTITPTAASSPSLNSGLHESLLSTMGEHHTDRQPTVSTEGSNTFEDCLPLHGGQPVAVEDSQGHNSVYQYLPLHREEPEADDRRPSDTQGRNPPQLPQSNLS